MNRYILIHRLTGPAILLLLGIVALLAELHIVHFFGVFVPLLLILLGVIKLAERAALAGWDFSQGPFGGAPYADARSGYAPTSQTGSTSIVSSHELGSGGNDAGEGKL